VALCCWLLLRTDLLDLCMCACCACPRLPNCPSYVCVLILSLLNPCSVRFLIVSLLNPCFVCALKFVSTNIRSRGCELVPKVEYLVSNV
jgi:hypothetical protein